MQPHTGLRENSITYMQARSMPIKQFCRWQSQCTGMLFFGPWCQTLKFESGHSPWSAIHFGHEMAYVIQRL